MRPLRSLIFQAVFFSLPAVSPFAAEDPPRQTPNPAPLVESSAALSPPASSAAAPPPPHRTPPSSERFASPVPGTKFPIPFAAGEQLRFGLAWLAIGGGEMTITVSPPRTFRGREAFMIRMEAASNAFFSKFFPVKDTITSYVEASRFESMRYEKHTEEGRHKNDDTFAFDLEKRETFHKGKRLQLPSHILDTLSAVYYLRLLPLAAGKSFALDAYNNGKNYTLNVEVLGKEEVSVGAGTFQAWKLEPKMSGGFFQKKEGRMLIWIADDPKKTLVRIRTYLPVGYITASLLAPGQPAPEGENSAFPDEDAAKSSAAEPKTSESGSQ